MKERDVILAGAHEVREAQISLLADQGLPLAVAAGTIVDYCPYWVVQVLQEFPGGEFVTSVDVIPTGTGTWDIHFLVGSPPRVFVIFRTRVPGGAARRPEDYRLHCCERTERGLLHSRYAYKTPRGVAHYLAGICRDIVASQRMGLGECPDCRQVGEHACPGAPAFLSDEERRLKGLRAAREEFRR